LNALVVGVSADKQVVQQRFIDKFGLTFPMIADTDKSIIGAYGAAGVLGVTAARTTVLIDPEGRIAHIWPSVKVDGHAQDVLGVLRDLQAAHSA